MEYEPVDNSGLMAMMGTFLLFYGVIILLILISLWKIYAKAGKPGWAAIVPIYNMIVWLENREQTGLVDRPFAYSLCKHCDCNNALSPALTGIWSGNWDNASFNFPAIYRISYAGIWQRSIPGSKANGDTANLTQK